MDADAVISQGKGVDQSLFLRSEDRRRAIESLSRSVASSVEAASAIETPFHHLVLDRVFPSHVYAAMLEAMPRASDYRPMSGRSREATNAPPTRVKIDLFPEYIRGLPSEKRAVLDVVGRALCSREVKLAFVQRLAPGLRRRFGAEFAKVGMYPVPILTRDIPGYKIPPHPDTRWKGITVQLYLPPDDTTTHLGTIFHERLPDGSLPKRTQMKFAPNTGYAFAVGDDTWHSADTVGPEVKTRDSILLTYFVDAGLLRFLRNRGKRIGNFLGNELRHRVSR
jgi:hypothetical protein